MNLPAFLFINFIAFGTLLTLYCYGFNDKACLYAKYLIAFFFGMVVMGLIA